MSSVVSAGKESQKLLKASGQCVLNIPTAELARQVVDTRMVRRYELFVLEVLAAWVDPAVKNPRTLHHRGYGRFMVAGDTIRQPSKMR